MAHKLGWLKAIGIHSVTVVEARSLKSRFGQGGSLLGSKGGSVPCLFTSFCWLPAILGVPGFIAAYLPVSVFIWLSSFRVHMASHLLIRAPAIEFRAHLTPVWPHFSLIISAKILFPNMVTFCGSRWTWLLCKHSLHSTGRDYSYLCFTDKETEAQRDEATVSASPGNLLHMHILRPYPRPPESETLGVGPGRLFNKPSKGILRS